MRSYIAYRLMRLALYFDTDMVVRMCMSIAAENTRRHMEAAGIDRFRTDEDGEGNTVIVPVLTNPTVH